MKLENLYQKYTEAQQRVTTDTRSVSLGSLFFALRGAHFNGNEFAQEALLKGASCAVIDDPDYQVEGKTILVDNVLQTLQELAQYHRRRLQTLIIAITGSNGKTTTKELTKAVLSQSFCVQATEGNLNNHIGVPLTLLSIKNQTDIAIVEMGANHPGEIASLCEIAEPDYGYITSLGKAHLEGFGDFQGVVRAKGELYAYLKKHQKMIFVNFDDTYQRALLQDYERFFSFGSGDEAHLFLKEVENQEKVIIQDGQNEYYTSHLTGRYNASNVAAAIAIGRYLKMSKSAIQRGVASYVPSNNRSQIIQTKFNKVILDAYNANPSSMRAAIENILAMPQGNKFLILGDMRELGVFSSQEHQSLVDFISQFSWEGVFLVGEEFSKIKTNFKQFESFELLEQHLKENSLRGNCLLIKGSRAMALERVLPWV